MCIKEKTVSLHQNLMIKIMDVKPYINPFEEGSGDKVEEPVTFSTLVPGLLVFCYLPGLKREK